MSEHKILFSVLNQSGSHKDNNFFYQWRQRRQYVRVTPWREDRASPSRLKRNREREIAVETIFFALFRRAEVSAWQERRAIHAREKWCLYARKIIPTVPAVIYERGCPVENRKNRWKVVGAFERNLDQGEWGCGNLSLGGSQGGECWSFELIDA